MIILVLALCSIMVTFLLCWICAPVAFGSLAMSIPAVVMARTDLAAIDRGEMSRHGRDSIQAGLVIGIVSAALSVIAAIGTLLLMIFYGGLIGLAALSSQH